MRLPPCLLGTRRWLLSEGVRIFRDGGELFQFRRQLPHSLPLPIRQKSSLQALTTSASNSPLLRLGPLTRVSYHITSDKGLNYIRTINTISFMIKQHVTITTHILSDLPSLPRVDQNKAIYNFSRYLTATCWKKMRRRIIQHNSSFYITQFTTLSVSAHRHYLKMSVFWNNTRIFPTSLYRT